MSADAVDDERERTTFLDGIAFLTGEDPSAGAFLLVVGMTTCVFIAGFQLAFPAPISYILTALVLVVAVISFIIGAILDILDYFEPLPEDAAAAGTGVGTSESDATESTVPDSTTAESEEAHPVDASDVDMQPVDTRQVESQPDDT
jgi:hypothetical protein